MMIKIQIFPLNLKKTFKLKNSVDVLFLWILNVDPYQSKIQLMRSAFTRSQYSFSLFSIIVLYIYDESY